MSNPYPDYKRNTITVPAQQEPVECQYGKGGYACCEGGPCKADEQNNAPQPAQQCRTDGRCQYAIDSGAEGVGYCPKGKCVMPAQRTWVGLTDEAIWLEYQRFWPFHPAEEPTLAKDIAKFANAIEAKLKEKNT